MHKIVFAPEGETPVSMAKSSLSGTFMVFKSLSS